MPKVDSTGTRRLRSQMAGAQRIKITLNIDLDSIEMLRKMSEETGVPYQRLLNRILNESLSKRNTGKKNSVEARLDRIERELNALKRSTPHASGESD